MKSARMHLVHTIFSMLPATRCFLLKSILLRWAGAGVGKNVRVVSSAKFYLSGDLTIGDGTWIGHEVLIAGGDSKITIGKNVDIAPRVSLISGTHELFGVEGRAAGNGYSLPIIIEDGVWLGACSTILAGVRVGSCSLVAAGALVDRAVPSNCVVGGVPAKEINRK